MRSSCHRRVAWPVVTQLPSESVRTVAALHSTEADRRVRSRVTCCRTKNAQMNRSELPRGRGNCRLALGLIV